MSSLIEMEYRDSAFNARMLTFAIINRDHIDIRDFLYDAYNIFENEISLMLENRSVVKVNTVFSATFEKIIVQNSSNSTAENAMEVEDDNGNSSAVKKEKETLYIHTSSVVVDKHMDLYDFFKENVLVYVLRKVDEAILQGSGFTLSTINELLVQVNKHDPLRGGSYMELSKCLADKKAIINVKNDDDMCFKWAILSALYPANNKPQRVQKYFTHKDKLNFTGIEFPIKVRDIDRFEKLNLIISVNVYIFNVKEKKVQPLRLTKETKKHHVNLLLLAENLDVGDVYNEPVTNYHYCWIKNLSRLVSAQISKHNGKLDFCDRCLNHFQSEEKFGEHKIACAQQNVCQIEMPVSGSDIVKFKNIKNQLESPFIIYADVEALLKKPTDLFSKSGATSAFQQHEVYSIGYYMKCSFDDSKSYYKANRGPDCIDWFVNELNEAAFKFTKLFNKNVPMRMTPADDENFKNAKFCHICESPFKFGKDTIVRDHCHFTGKFRGAAHQACNLLYQENRTIPIVFHNLTNYDSHFLLEKLKGIDGSIQIIPINTEKYISFTKTVAKSAKKFANQIKYKFIDSFRFMASSLDYLASLIPSEKKTILRKECQGMTEEQLHLLEKKGVFCYDYVDSWGKLDETSLPSKEDFFSRLTNEHISDEKYNFAKEVWDKFNIQTLGEYADLYLRVDVCLLAIVFENFRETCRQIYNLDPANYFTAPGLSFDAMLRYTKVELELLKDVDMLMFIERGIRGGISQCSLRYMEANNKYMETYDKEKESSYIMYVDCNNLYGHSMMQHLPIKGFQWCEDEFTAQDIENLTDEADIGYIFEVDLDYPEELHDLHNDYPFCAENRRVPGAKNVKKLLTTLFDKKNYVVHYRMLKLALQHGLKLKKIHRALQFEQTSWLKSYIELNTAMRAKANNDFEKNLYKLQNNAIFGKCMENVRARSDIRLVNKWEGRYGAGALISNPTFKRRTIFNENLVALEMHKTSILMNKPISVGMAILDLSKVVMYEYYYNFLKKKYGENIRLAYTDTDSFVLHVKTDDFYEDMKDDLDRYDTSDYPENNQFQMQRVNKKIPGLFKDELNSEIVTAFVGLRSKMYCVRTGCIDKMKKAKGVKSSVLKKEIGFDDYVKCLNDSCVIAKEQNSFRTKLHNMYTIQQTKIALSPFDDKRCFAKGQHDTYAHGHKAGADAHYAIHDGGLVLKVARKRIAEIFRNEEEVIKIFKKNESDAE